jgi:acyl transferase domain-containing protein
MTRHDAARCAAIGGARDGAGMADRDKIAIVGVACRFPGSRDFEAYARLLAEGRSAFEPVARDDAEPARARGIDPADPDWVGVCAPLADAECFDADLFGYTARAAQVMDPQQRVAMQCAYAALEDAAILPATVDHAVGLYLASSPSTFLLEYLSAPELRASLGADALALVNHGDFLATAISYRLDLRGPSMGIQTACSGSLVAVHAACEALRGGLCELALAGGVSVRMPQRSGYLAPRGGVASRSGACLPFAEDADGTLFGSGAGVVVLQRLEDAVAHRSRILGIILGSAVNNDGRARMGFTAPSQAGQAAVVAEAVAAAGLTPEEVMYVEAHGTGTRVGDDIELRALADVFDGRRGPPLPIGSCKGNIGHADAAAGVAGLLKVLAAFRQEAIPATLGAGTCSTSDKVARSLTVVRQALAWPPGERRRAGVSSFGIGGTNAHLVVEAPPGAAPAASFRPARRGAAGAELLTVAAATPQACVRRARDLAAWLDASPDARLADVAHTQHVGREPLPHRISVVAADPRAASRALRLATPVAAAARPAVLLLLPDHDPRAAETALVLCEEFPAFRAHFMRIAQRIRAAGGPDLALRNRGPDAARDHGLASLALSLALAHTLAELGLAPEAFSGEGLGEWAAAMLAGVLDQEHAIGALCQGWASAKQHRDDAAIQVALSAGALAQQLAAGLVIVAVASRASTVVGGPRSAISALRTRLDRMGIPWEAVQPDELGGRLPPVAQCIQEGLAGGVATAAWLSPSAGRVFEAGERAEAGFLVAHAARPIDRVALADMLVRRLGGQAGRFAADIGPSGGLARAMRSIAGQDLRVWNAPGPLADPRAWLLALVGVLYGAGAPLRLERLYRGATRERVSLPAYPFARTGALPQRDAAPVGVVAASLTMRQPAWCRGAREERPSHLPARERWLVLLRDPSDAVAQALHRAGADVVTVQAGDAFEQRGPAAFIARPGEAMDLAAAVAAGGFTRVLHRWSSGPEGQDERERGVVAAIHLLRALAALPARMDLRVFFATEHAIAVEGGAAAMPARAALGALARVAGQEIPGLWSAHIDAPAQAAPDLADALRAPRPSPVFALRGGSLWLPAYAPVMPEPDDASLLVHGGVYVIVGGTGRFGTMIGRHLVDQRGATVVAVARRASAGGTGFQFRQADIGEREEVFGLFRSLQGRYGRIDGVIFAAGEVSADTHRAIAELGDEEVALQFERRVRGFMNVHDALLELDVPMKLVTASMSPILGGLGLGAYGAAHAWIDAVVDASPDWRAIHWEGWHRDPSVPAVHATGAAQAQSRRMLSRDEVCAAFETAMHARIPRRIVVTREDLERRLAQWLPRAPASAAATVPPAARATTASEVRAELARILTSLLGVEPGDDEDFFELGGNSLIAVQFLGRLRDSLGMDVPLRLLFEHPTVARLSLAIEAIRPGGPRAGGAAA